MAHIENPKMARFESPCRDKLGTSAPGARALRFAPTPVPGPSNLEGVVVDISRKAHEENCDNNSSSNQNDTHPTIQHDNQSCS